MISCSACVFHPQVCQCSPEIKKIYCLRSTYFIGGVKFLSCINKLTFYRQKINIRSFKHSKFLDSFSGLSWDALSLIYSLQLLLNTLSQAACCKHPPQQPTTRLPSLQHMLLRTIKSTLSRPQQPLQYTHLFVAQLCRTASAPHVVKRCL